MTLILALTIVAFTPACQSDDDNNNTANKPGYSVYKVSMTDAPGNFTEVNIHIQQIRVHSDISGWVDLTTKVGIYNLLDFVNGIDTLIASDSIPSGRVSQIRFVLGDSNSVVVNGIEHTLIVPSGSESGLKLQVNHDLIPNITYDVLVDFDAAQSIVLTGNGRYILKPVLRVITHGLNGGIKGDIDPNNVFSKIFAVNGTDTTGATPDSLGMFTINGLEADTYDVYINPVPPYLADTFNNVVVTSGSITNLGSIMLQQ
tara:strand:+ start:97 stop:870 length:774 start_codon:yes stop_codon:yes gene_type:complete